jgi:phosphotransferase system enzyme I (PtsI)
MSFVLHGVGVSGGIAIGHAHLVTRAKLEAAHYDIPVSQVPEECARYETATRTVRSELEEVRSSVPATAPTEFAAFIDLHLMILNDATLSATPCRTIVAEQCNAEWALKVQMDALLAQFEEIDDAYLRERKADVVQVVERIMKALSGQPGYIPPPPEDGRESRILVAHDLSPADVVQFKPHQFASFITDVGGVTSHTAVVARSLNVPCIVALHNARALIRENELVIVDGTQGVVIVDPDSHVLAEYELRRHQFEIDRQKLKRLRDTRPVTLDGVEVELQANIELPGDVGPALENGAMGVGLFRTEFLFLNRDTPPDEEEQFEAYRRVVQGMEGLPVTIRTYDLGADKVMDGALNAASNPALGLRAIRLSLTEPQGFLIQLRAMLRASHYGRVNILIPMLMNATEVDQVLHMIARAKASLDEQRIPYAPDIKVGGMVEVPAAALALGIFTRKLNFLSVGTNDLIQYMLAVDRTDDTVAHLYDPLHPAILNILSHVFRTAAKAGIPVALCGEMAGDVRLTRLLLALGLRQFSMHSAHLLDVKQHILTSSLQDIRPLGLKMLRTEDPEKLHALLARLNG